MAQAFPERLIARKSETFWLTDATRSGGASFTGSQQFVASPASRWRGRFSLHLLTDDDYLEARGFLAGLDGQAGTFMTGPIDWRGQPWNIDPLLGGALTPGRTGGQSAEFDANPDTTGRLIFSLAGPVAMNATVIPIQRTQGGRLRRGQYLQIGERLHTIIGLTTADPSDVNGEAAPGIIGAAIRPWLRQDYAQGTPIEFAKPQGLMRLADADQAYPEMTPTPLGDLTLNLIEAF